MEAGRVGRPHGLDGSFHVTRPRSDVAADEVIVRGATVRVIRRSGTVQKPILRLEGHATREAAEALRGEPLLVPREAVALDEDEYWARDLIGCEVVGLGEVTELVELPSCEALQVGDVLVPMVRDAIVSIDLDARRIEVNREFLGAD